MIQLPHGNRCSEITVHPENWEKITASTKKDWYIFYRFNCEEHPKGFLVQVKGMNRMKNRKDRVEITRGFIEDEKRLLFQGYNPALKITIPVEGDEYEIHPNTGMFEALEAAYKKVNVSGPMRACMKSALKICEPYASRLNIKILPVAQVKRRHMVRLLKMVQAERPLSPGNYNHYRAYFISMFKELRRCDAVEYNPMDGIDKQKEVKKIRKVLTLEERKKLQMN